MLPLQVTTMGTPQPPTYEDSTTGYHQTQSLSQPPTANGMASELMHDHTFAMHPPTSRGNAASTHHA